MQNCRFLVVLGRKGNKMWQNIELIRLFGFQYGGLA